VGAAPNASTCECGPTMPRHLKPSRQHVQIAPSAARQGVCRPLPLEVITSPTRARHALSYVLSNWRKHKEDQHGLASTWLVDPYSSGISFPDWKELEDKAFMWPIRATYDPLMVRRPQSWLLREGWKLCGSISARDVPSQRT